MLQTVGIERVIELLNTDLSVIAIGNGTAPAVSGTQLTAETLRKTVTTSLVDGNTLVKEIYFDESEANGTITEIGLLGDGATGTVGSGNLFASGAAAIVKDSTQSLTVSFEIEVKEVI
jgi:hypothetical protein